MNPDQIQQGDVTLERIASLPSGVGVKELPRINGRIVLAEGSQSGNSHYVDAPGAKFYEDAHGVRYLFNPTDAPIELKHTREHDPVLVGHGVHQVGHIHEVDHLTGLVSKVVD
jgi:hypothetical protein